MTRAQDQAIARVCAHECLMGELVEALEKIDQTFVDDFTVDAESETGKAIIAARSVLARAKEQA